MAACVDCLKALTQPMQPLFYLSVMVVNGECLMRLSEVTVFKNHTEKKHTL